MRGSLRLFRLMAVYLHANVQGALEYRVSFATQVLGMVINDLVWLVFWVAYFDRFPLVEGWGREEIVTLWAVVACGFGLGTTLAGNTNRLSSLIIGGELDVYLTLPRPVLPHVLISRMNPTAPGDVLFGVGVFALLVHPDLTQWLLFATFSVTTALILVSAAVLAHSLTFWMGNAGPLAQQFTNALLTFATYPTSIFPWRVKLVLFTVVPAAFVGFVPVELLFRFSFLWFGAVLGVAGALVGVSVLVFRLGLRRYESGNLMVTRD